MKTKRIPAKQKPLLVIDGPLKAKVYRSEFTPFETLRFIDEKKLKSSRRVMIEIGTIAAQGESATLVAEVKKGMVTALTLQQCEGCGPKVKSKGAAKKYEAAFRQIAERVDEVSGGGDFALPVSFRSCIDTIVGTFWPIVIIFEPHDDGSWCIAVRVGRLFFCVYCSDLPGIHCV